MPQVILHVGLPKTGSTALQKTLQACEDTLRSHGVLYPTYDLHKPDFLVPYLYRAQPLTHMGRIALREATDRESRRQLYARMKRDPSAREELKRKVQRLAEENWADLLAQSNNEGIGKVILSDELLCNAPDDPEIVAHVRTSMAELSDDIRIVAYVRSPASRFLSGAGQKLKTLQPVPKTGTKSYAYQATFERLANLGIGPIELRDFSRDVLVDGDIVADFQTHYIPEVPERLTADLTGETNENISAEAMVAFQLLLSIGKGGSKLRRLSSTNPAKIRQVKLEIFRLDQETEGFSKPKLKPEAVEAVVRSQASDLFWLRDTYGITFKDVDYDALEPGMSHDNAILQKVPDFCEVNEERLAVMREKLFEKVPELRKLAEGRRRKSA